MRCSAATLGEASGAMQASLQKISEAGCGVVLYLRQRENNLDLVNQLRTYALMQEKGLIFRPQNGNWIRKDSRLRHRSTDTEGSRCRRIRLLTNHPPKVNAIEAFGLEITETVGL